MTHPRGTGRLEFLFIVHRSSFILLFLLLSGGCEWMKKNAGGGGVKPPVAGRGTLPEQTAASLVGYLNTQARYLDSLGYKDVRVELTADRESFTLTDGVMFCAKPRYFRMNAGHLLAGSNQFDIGSNSDQFWMYVKQMPGQNFFYCSHDDYNGGRAKLPVPFETDWVLQALGMVEYPTDPGQYVVEPNDQRWVYVLKRRATTPQGQPVWRATVINADTARDGTPQVAMHAVIDMNNRKICSATIKEVRWRTVGEGANAVQVQVPRRVVLEWPQEKFVMDLTLDQEEVNKLTQDRLPTLFRIPEIRGANPVNLAEYRFASPSSATRGQAPDRDTRRPAASSSSRPWWRR